MGKSSFCVHASRNNNHIEPRRLTGLLSCVKGAPAWYIVELIPSSLSRDKAAAPHQLHMQLLMLRLRTNLLCDAAAPTVSADFMAACQWAVHLLIYIEKISVSAQTKSAAKIYDRQLHHSQLALGNSTQTYSSQLFKWNQKGQNSVVSISNRRTFWVKYVKSRHWPKCCTRAGRVLPSANAVSATILGALLPGING